MIFAIISCEQCEFLSEIQRAACVNYRIIWSRFIIRIFMFWFKKKLSTEDMYLNTLIQSDWEWKVLDEEYRRQVLFIPKNWHSIKFTWKKYWWCEEESHWSTRAISRSFVEKIENHANEYIMNDHIRSIWWYILDEDLQKAFTDAKSVMNAKWQIDFLVDMIEKIRKKY